MNNELKIMIALIIAIIWLSFSIASGNEELCGKFSLLEYSFNGKQTVKIDEIVYGDAMATVRDYETDKRIAIPKDRIISITNMRCK